MSTSLTLVPLRSAEHQQFVLPHFYAGPENRLVSFVCSSEASIVERGNPILLYGDSGVGKSAVAHWFLQTEATQPKRSLLSEPAIDFARRYAKAVDSDKVSEFRDAYLSAHVMLIEDVHLIPKKVAAQDELASCISARVERDLPTIVTCRRLPTEIDGLRPGLVSRLLPGLSIPLVAPGPDARRAIITAVAEARGLELSDALITRLDKDLPPNATVSALHSAISQLALSAAPVENDRVSEDDIDSITASFKPAASPTMSAISKAVASRFGLKLADLKSSSRRQKVVRARSMAMFLGRKLTDQSLQAIGIFFGGRDHSTVIHAIRSTEDLIAADQTVARTANDVADHLKAS